MQERSLLALSKFSLLPSATEMQIDGCDSGYRWKGSVLARSTVVLITEPQKRKMLHSVAIYLLLFFLNSCCN